MTIEAREQNKRLEHARELVTRHQDGHELGIDELAAVVEAGLLGELLSAIGTDCAPLWPSKNNKTTDNTATTRTDDGNAKRTTRSIP